MSNPNRRIIYLHGFASGPASHKARCFAAAFAERGLDLAIPDLNEGDFSALTVSRQLALLERMTATQASRSVFLIGSSMGAYVAALFAARSARIGALILLAPAFGFIERWVARFSAEGLAEWQRRGIMPVFHYGTGKLEPIGWNLIEDARQYPALPVVEVPVLVVHGRQDETVDYRQSERFAAQNPSVVLELREADHSLAAAVPWIIERSGRFLAPWFHELS